MLGVGCELDPEGVAMHQFLNRTSYTFEVLPCFPGLKTRTASAFHCYSCLFSSTLWARYAGSAVVWVGHELDSGTAAMHQFCQLGSI